MAQITAARQGRTAGRETDRLTGADENAFGWAAEQTGDAR